MDQSDDTTWQFWFTIRKAAAISQRQLEAIITKEIGITLGQFMVISVIDAYPGTLNQTAIADHLGLTKGTVSRLIESGTKSGWIVVTPDPASRRSRLVVLTPAGTDLVRRGDLALADSAPGEYPNTNPAVARATAEMLQQYINAARGYEGHATVGLPPKNTPRQAGESPQGFQPVRSGEG